jgi:hypothetical protein
MWSIAVSIKEVWG